MAVDLGRAFPVDFAGIPPHVSQNDLRLWEEWRRVYAKEYVGLYFDVALGQGTAAPPGTPDNLASAWRRLTQFRADLVADHGDRWDLIEFRPNAGPGAIGAVQVYSSLWRAAPPDGRPLRVLIVTDRMATEAALVARLAGVEVVELEA